VARIDPDQRKVLVAHGEVEGSVPYDYLIFALGRRLATERITGFYEHANHVLSLEGALKFGKAIHTFHKGRAVIGQCPGARLPVPVYETAFALSRLLKERGDTARITVVSPEPPGLTMNDLNLAPALRDAMEAHQIEFVPDFAVERISSGVALTSNRLSINFNLLMLLPPFTGSSVASYLGITDREGFVNVNPNMKVTGVERMYAVGDCVNLGGPKMGHMAIRQAEVAAINLAAELLGQPATATYKHEMRFVIDDGGTDSIYVHKNLSSDESASVRQGRFWSWAKQAQKRYWEAKHS
jgi:sulfide:quinone oxidoreductase